MNKENRTIQLHFYVNEQEYEKIKEGKASAHIRGLSTYLRRMAIYGHIIHVDMSEIQKLTSLLGICSNNLNQYARKAHQTDSIYQTDIEDIRERLNEIRVEIGKLMDIYSKIFSL
ncbi:MAG: plasmid mobilization relaxosome protein MobC [Ruminococcus sp.]|nr:plasmid mobilization relaxosome protein MobC [Ruminococcus sp.]